MTPARVAVVVIVAGATICACLIDTSGFTGGTADAGAPDAASEAGAPEVADGAIATDGSAAVDAGFYHPSTATLWPVNGHYYEVISASITWDDARSAAVARGGHLATTTTAAENLFVWGLVMDLDPPPVADGESGPWLGGRQADGAVEPGGGWGWITGETWTYTAWHDAEPNDASHNENVVGYLYGPEWADYLEDSEGPGYVIEYEP